MSKKIHSLLVLFALSGVILFNGCSVDNDGEVIIIPQPAVIKPNLPFIGLTASNQLVALNANAPGTVIGTVTITGLPPGEKITDIDFRPATGQLYGLGIMYGRIYIINPVTGVATVVGTSSFSPALTSPLAGMDFNPTVDRIRIVNASGQNLRVNPETGVTVGVDAGLNPAGVTPAGAAYTNSFSGASATTLYTIDFLNRNLYKQDPPNSGLSTIVGGFQLASGGNVGGFDISPDNTVSLATYNYGGAAGLMRVDLTTGLTVDLGALSTPLIGLAIPTVPVAYSVEVSTNNLLILNLQTPVIPIFKPITGLQPGESVLGIDFRPATNQLYALGSTSRLYKIDLGTGVATAAGGVFGTLLSGTNFGFDFNPTVDRVRVVSNTGQNLRLDPNTGAIAAVDVALNPGAPAVSAAAYTNNFVGAVTTTLYVIDPLAGNLYIQNPPNNGTLTLVGSLGVGLSVDNGFDIGGVSGKAFGFFNTGSTNKIYNINLTTGAATEFTTVAATTRGFTVGLGM
ncbi:MAG: DUF4394 domain-containing protein [Chitinophagaceae bacterium]